MLIKDLAIAKVLVNHEKNRLEVISPSTKISIDSVDLTDVSSVNSIRIYKDRKAISNKFDCIDPTEYELESMMINLTRKLLAKFDGDQNFIAEIRKFYENSTQYINNVHKRK